ncbi:hypothetical protein IOCL2690_000101800 [Leishmania lindenbergi]|uniref:Uncharacterized protein n=1 Tax=Leishmania lindenbergi TaxID=651832 RepID=A0AAW3AWZ5_9TRYP
MDGVLVEEATTSGSQRNPRRRGSRPVRGQQQQKCAEFLMNDDYSDIDDDGSGNVGLRCSTGPSHLAGYTSSCYDAAWPSSPSLLQRPAKPRMW